MTKGKVAAAVGAVALTATGAGVGVSQCNTPPTVVTVPPSVTADCSKDVTAQLDSLLASVPANATIQLGAKACYLVSQSPSNLLVPIFANGVTIDGNGATLHQNTYVGGNQQQPVLTLGGTTGLKVNNLNIVGPSSTGGSNAEGDIGVLMWQDSGATLSGVQIGNVEGDGLDLLAKHGNDPGVSTNVVVTGKSAIGPVGYHAIVPEYVKGLTFEDSAIGNGNIDAEVDFNCQTTWPSGCGTLANPSVGVVNMTIQNDIFPQGLQLLDGVSCMPVGNWAVLNNNFGTGGFDLEMNTTYSLSLGEFNTCGQYDGLKVEDNTSTATSIHPCCGAGSPYVLIQGWKNVTISGNSLVLPTNQQGAVIELWGDSNVAISKNTLTNAQGVWDSSPPAGWPPKVVPTTCGNTWGPASAPQKDGAC
jgi:hypothetical protein